MLNINIVNHPVIKHKLALLRKAISLLKEKGARSISLVCIVLADRRVSLINKKHPDTPIHTAAVDPVLNEKGFIVPGVGDAGDRLFGTT